MEKNNSRFFYASFVLLAFLLFFCPQKIDAALPDAVHFQNEVKKNEKGLYDVTIKVQNATVEEIRHIIVAFDVSAAMDQSIEGKKSKNGEISRWTLLKTALGQFLDKTAVENSGIFVSLLAYGGSTKAYEQYSDHKVLIANAKDVKKIKESYEKFDSAKDLRKALFGENPARDYSAANGDAGFYGVEALLKEIENENTSVLFIGTEEFNRCYDQKGNVLPGGDPKERANLRAMEIKKNYPSVEIFTIGFGSEQGEDSFLNPQKKGNGYQDAYYSAADGKVLGEVFTLLSQKMVTPAKVVYEIGDNFTLAEPSIPYGATLTKENHIVWHMDNLAYPNVFTFSLKEKAEHCYGVESTNKGCSLIYTPTNSNHPVTITQFAPIIFLKPYGNNDIAHTQWETEVAISLLENDVDSREKQILDGIEVGNPLPYLEEEPKKGSLVKKEGGVFLYRPQKGFQGRDTFTYRLGAAMEGKWLGDEKEYHEILYSDPITVNILVHAPLNATLDKNTFTPHVKNTDVFSQELLDKIPLRSDNSFIRSPTTSNPCVPANFPDS